MTQLLALCVWAVLVPLVAAEDVMTLVLPGGTKRLSLGVSLAGQSPQTRWQAFLNRWFAYFDRDDDGKLTPAEAARIFPVPRTNGSTIVFDFRRSDVNGDSVVTRTELTNYYQTAVFRSLVGLIEPATVQDLQLADAM